jgi:hypothetical protein
VKINFINKTMPGVCILVLFLTGIIAHASQIVIDFENPPFPSFQAGVVVGGITTASDRNHITSYGPYNILPCVCADTPPNAAFGYVVRIPKV